MHPIIKSGEAGALFTIDVGPVVFGPTTHVDCCGKPRGRRNRYNRFYKYSRSPERLSGIVQPDGEQSDPVGLNSISEPILEKADPA